MLNSSEKEVVTDIEYNDLKEAMIEREVKERVKAIKLLTSSFEVDDVAFATSTYPVMLVTLATPDGFDKLAHILDKEVYETTIHDRDAIAFEYDGIEVIKYV